MEIKFNHHPAIDLNYIRHCEKGQSGYETTSKGLPLIFWNQGKTFQKKPNQAIGCEVTCLHEYLMTVGFN